MIDLEFVQQLIRTVDESSIDTVEIERGGTRIRVSKTPNSPGGGGGSHAPAAGAAQASHNSSPGALAPAPASVGGQEDSAPAVAEDADWIAITSPMVGTFYRAPSPGADDFTEVGKRIVEGDVLCIIEAMKLMNELESEVEGVVKEICVENGEPVEYGQVLFRVSPD